MLKRLAIASLICCTAAAAFAAEPRTLPEDAGAKVRPNARTAPPMAEPAKPPPRIGSSSQRRPSGIPASQIEARQRPDTAQPQLQRRPLCVARSSPEAWALEGTLIAPHGVIPHGVVTIAGPKIAGVKASGLGEPRACATNVDGIILPGLIDLHNHLTWNVHPRWQPPKEYSNRQEWRLSDENQQTLALPQKALVWAAPGLGCEANLYGEVRALIGGATATVGGLDIHRAEYSQKAHCIGGLVRNLDYDSQLADPVARGNRSPVLQAGEASVDLCSSLIADGHPISEMAVNEIFPLGAENIPNDIPALSEQRVKYLKCNLGTGKLRSLLVHLAEGKPADSASHDEFQKLEALGLVRAGLIVVHGTALQPSDFATMQSGGAGLVWSPRSNMELYGATMDVAAARNAGVPIAIAPDWTPTGSDGMLQELNYARGAFSHFNAEQLTAMATSVPARIARLDDRIGQLKAGLYADLLVVRRKRSAYDSVVTATPADVRLVVVGGRPVYGDAALMQQLAPDAKLTPITVCGTAKAIDFGGTIAAQSSWDAVQAALQQRLGQSAYPTELGSFDCQNVRPGRLPREPMLVPIPIPGEIRDPEPVDINAPQ